MIFTRKLFCLISAVLLLAVSLYGCGFQLRGTELESIAPSQRSAISISVKSEDPELRYVLTKALQDRGFRVVMTDPQYLIEVSESSSDDESELDAELSTTTKTQRYSVVFRMTQLGGSGSVVSKRISVETDYTSVAADELIRNSVDLATTKMSQQKAVDQIVAFVIRKLGANS